MATSNTMLPITMADALITKSNHSSTYFSQQSFFFDCKKGKEIQKGKKKNTTTYLRIARSRAHFLRRRDRCLIRSIDASTAVVFLKRGGKRLESCPKKERKPIHLLLDPFRKVLLVVFVGIPVSGRIALPESSHVHLFGLKKGKKIKKDKKKKTKNYLPRCGWRPR